MRNDTARNRTLCLAASSVAQPWNPVLLRPCDAPAGLATRWAFISGGGDDAAGRTLRPAEANGSLCLDWGSQQPRLSCASAALVNRPYCDASLPPSARAHDLVARMTLAGSLIHCHFKLAINNPCQ